MYHSAHIGLSGPPITVERSGLCLAFFPWPPLPSLAFSVGQDPKPFTPMPCTTFGRRDNAPFRIEPNLGQRSKDFAEIVMGQKVWDVLQERESGSHLANDSDGVRPKVSFVIASAIFSGTGERLARESRSDDIHESTPWTTIEGAGIVPDGEQR